MIRLGPVMTKARNSAVALSSMHNALRVRMCAEADARYGQSSGLLNYGKIQQKSDQQDEAGAEAGQ